MKTNSALAEQLAEIDRNVASAKKFLAYFIGALLVFYVVWFGIVVKSKMTEDPGDWGAFGDYMGGLLNPVVGFFALHWLIKSVRLQKEELCETRKALEESAETQEKQLELAALTALVNSIMTEIDVQRVQLVFLCDQLKILSVHGIIGLGGESLTKEQALETIRKINDRISARLGERHVYEGRIQEILNENMRKPLTVSSDFYFKA